MPTLIDFDSITTGISPRQICIDNAASFYAKLSPVTGHLISTTTGLSLLADTTTNYLDLSSMKSIHWVARSGILRGDPVYIDQFLLSCEALLSYRNQITPDIDPSTGPGTPWIVLFEGVPLPDGSFPAESGGRTRKNCSLHHKIIVMDRMMSGIWELMESVYYTGAVATRVDAIVAMTNSFADFIVNFNDHADAFIDGAGAGNQTISIITFLQHIGRATGNTAYTDKARTIFEWIRDDDQPKKLVALLTDTTTNVAVGSPASSCFMTEKKNTDDIGFDGSYNSLSLELMCHYYMALEAGLWKDEILTYIEAMLEHELLTIETNSGDPAYGTVYDTKSDGAWNTWTRVHETLPIVRVPNSTDYNYCSIAHKINTATFLTGTNTAIPAAIHAVGQRFGHIADDPGTVIDDPAPSHGGMNQILRKQLFLTSQGRMFDVSPAVSGKTTWNLDRDGPCTFPVGVYTITPRDSFAGIIELWGPSGGTGGIGTATGTNGTAGANTTFTPPGADMVAGGGGRSTGKTSNGVGGAGSGGTSSGGDVNTSGSAGTDGTIAATSIAGSGGNAASPNGGTGATGASAGNGVTTAGTTGTTPGGGSSGSVHGSATNSFRRASSGSGGGGYCKKTFVKAQLVTGVARTLTVTAGGAAGTGDLANGAAGADGRAIIT